MVQWRNLFRSLAGSTGYIPGQREPQEYLRWVAGFVEFLRRGHLPGPVVIVGFDNLQRISTVLEGADEPRLRSSLPPQKHIFKQRNPVIVSAYSWNVSADVLVEDALKLRELGATDLSAVGVDILTAHRLREIFGKKSCPVLAVKPDA
jgi:hypothetical protein